MRSSSGQRQTDYESKNDIYRKRKREKERDREREREGERMTHQVKLDKTGTFVGKTHNSDKITGEEKCMSETEDVRERQRTGERR